MSGPVKLGTGGTLQSGIPKRVGPPRPIQGAVVRAAVMATYVTDDPNHPYADENPVSVYCDVLVYTQMPGSKFFYLKTVLVAQPPSGIQRGPIWKPRAATTDITGNPLDPNVATNPANLDGDHVLVSFIDGRHNQPVIIASLPHPSLDVGNSNYQIGQRLKLQLADGDPSFVKHHGAFYGVSDTGEFIVDTTLANDGVLNSDGSEQTGQEVGNHVFNFEQHCQRLTSLMNMSSPASPSAVMTEVLQVAGYVLDFMSNTPAWQVKAGSNNVLQLVNSGSSATMQVGDGSKHVAIVEQLQNLWGNLVTYLNTHTHPTSTGPSGPPSTNATTWDSSVNSSKVSIPNG